MLCHSRCNIADSALKATLCNLCGVAHNCNFLRRFYHTHRAEKIITPDYFCAVCPLKYSEIYLNGHNICADYTDTLYIFKRSNKLCKGGILNIRILRVRCFAEFQKLFILCNLSRFLRERLALRTDKECCIALCRNHNCSCLKHRNITREVSDICRLCLVCCYDNNVIAVFTCKLLHLFHSFKVSFFADLRFIHFFLLEFSPDLTSR